MFENVKEDIRAFRRHHGESWIGFFYYPMFSAVMMYRLSYWCYHHHLKLLAYALTRLNDLFHGVWIGPRVQIGPGFVLAHARGLVINPNTRIGQNCVILQNVALGGPGITIGDNVVISAGALIISRRHKNGTLKIGDNVIIGAGAVVLHDVAENAVMVGNPARNIQALHDKEI